MDESSFERLIKIQSYSDEELKELATQLAEDERVVVGGMDHLVECFVNRNVLHHLVFLGGRCDFPIQFGDAAVQAQTGTGKTAALGLPLEDKGLVQVSMNLINYTRTPIPRVLETIRAEAARYGVAIAGTELVGPVPLGALEEVAKYYLQVHDFSMEQVIELFQGMYRHFGLTYVTPVFGCDVDEPRNRAKSVTVE